MNTIPTIKIEPVCGLIESVQGATLQADGLWVGSPASVSYTVMVQTPEGEVSVAGLKPANGRLSSAYDIAAQAIGTRCIGVRVNGRIDMCFHEVAYWDACDGT